MKPLRCLTWAALACLLALLTIAAAAVLLLYAAPVAAWLEGL